MIVFSLLISSCFELLICHLSIQTPSYLSFQTSLKVKKISCARERVFLGWDYKHLTVLASAFCRLEFVVFDSGVLNLNADHILLKQILLQVNKALTMPNFAIYCYLNVKIP